MSTIGDNFKFELLPNDLKTQIFSFVRFADWIQILAQVCSEWRHLCKTTTLPKVLDVREILPPNYHTYNGASRDTLDRIVNFAQKFNTTGLVLDSMFDFKTLKKISKALPKLQWLQFVPLKGYRARITHEITPLSNSITHLDVTMIGFPMLFNELPPCFPNLQVLNYSTRLRLPVLQKMELKFDKVKVIRSGIKLDYNTGKRKPIKRRKTAGENVGQLIEFVEAFKKVAPSLTELYMFWEYKPQSTPAELKHEFEAVEEAASSMGIKLYCRDLVRILKSHTVLDPDGDFFLSCYAHNNKPYHAYTFNGFTLLQHAIAALNVKVVRLLFDNKLTNMEYELSVRNERNVVEPTAPCLTDSEKMNPFTISNLIPYANSTKAMDIVDILRENGYDVSAIIRLPTQQIYATPIWSRLKFTIPAVRRLFENYTRPIKWFDKMKGGETIAHKIMTIRGTPVYLDLMEKQLTKEQICDLMTVQDDKGNTPVHLIGESSLATFDRLIPYIKHCWTIKNNRNQTPFGSYIQRFKEFHIKLKEHKLRRFIQETPVIEDREVYELFRFVDKEDYLPVLPLLVEKGVNLTATGDGGIGFFFSSFTVEFLQEFKRHGVDLAITDEYGCNLLHGLFMERDRRDVLSIPALVEFLVKEGVNINQINKYGVTPLMKSMQKPSYKGLEAMEALLKNGADPNLHGPNTPTPLVMILGRNTSYTYPKQTKISLVKLLLDHGAKPTSIRIHGERFSPLAMAITNVNSIKLARLLIDYGADKNERDDLGNSMLHMIKEGPIGEVDEKKIFRMIDFLITYIDINDQNALGETTLHQILEYTEYAEYLVQKGADINIRDNRGNTPILMALDSVDFLLASPKLDWLAINRECKSALHILVRSYEERLKPFMEKFNAMSKEQQDAIKKVFSTNDGVHKTALHGAVSMLEFESVKVCVEVFGLSPAMQNKHLILCDDNRYESKRVEKLIRIFTYLLEHGANINAQDEKGNTALHYALRKDSYLILEYITFLLKNGADPTIKNYLGLSAKDLMPSIGNLISSGSCFSSKLPISAEEEAEKSRKLKVEDDIINNDEPDYDEEEFDEMFNSDEMSENDMMEANDEDEFGSEEEIIFPDEDIDDMDEDDDGEDDDDDGDDDDEDDDGRLRRHPGGFTFRL